MREQVGARSALVVAGVALIACCYGLARFAYGLFLPDLTAERRKELAKLAGGYAENAKIAIRNVRRDGMEALKDDEKKKDIGEDERKRGEDEVQKLTDKFVAQADEAAAAKEKEILSQ